MEDWNRSDVEDISTKWNPKEKYAMSAVLCGVAYAVHNLDDTGGLEGIAECSLTKVIGFLVEEFAPEVLEEAKRRFARKQEEETIRHPRTLLYRITVNSVTSIVRPSAIRWAVAFFSRGGDSSHLAQISATRKIAPEDRLSLIHLAQTITAEEFDMLTLDPDDKPAYAAELGISPTTLNKRIRSLKKRVVKKFS